MGEPWLFPEREEWQAEAWGMRHKLLPIIVPIEWVIMGEPQLGVWCDTCLLPAAIRLRIALLVPDSMTVLNISAYTLCEGCEIGTAVTDG